MIPALRTLRVAALDRLVLHEARDEARLERVREGLRSEGVQRNPVIAAPLLVGEPGGDHEGDRLLVLDGAHRVHALGSIGCRAALVQLVALPGCAEGWGHLLPAAGLEQRLRAVEGIEVRGGGEGDTSGTGHLLAEARFPGGRWLVLSARERGPVAGARALWALRAAYPTGERYRRIEPGEAVEPGEGEAVLLYRRFTPAGLLEVVEGGGVLPAGVTRFVVGERVLNVRLPLGVLRGRDPRERGEKLEAHVGAAWERGRVRYYGEPVILFE